MSFTDTRAELAAALSTVAGVTGYEFRPGTLKAGAAWPLLESIEPGPGNAFAGNWRVIFFLGGDEKLAQTKLDALVPAVLEAISPVAYVDQSRPLAFTSQGGDMFALEIICRSE